MKKLFLILAVAGLACQSQIPQPEPRNVATVARIATLTPFVGSYPQLRVTAYEGLNLRKLPRESSDLIVAMPYGQVVSDLGGRGVSRDGKQWCNVGFDRVIGWAWCDWLVGN